MTAETVVLPDRDAGIAGLRSVLGRWRHILRHYHERVPPRDERHDCIWWTSERSNVGALASAAWLEGIAAIEEFRADDASKSRCDLWLDLESSAGGIYVETKLLWLKTPRKRRFSRNPLRCKIEKATAQLEDFRHQHRLAVAFVVPFGPQLDPAAARKAVEPLIQESEHAWGRQSLVTAWCEVTGSPPKIPSWPPDGQFPGVLLIGRHHPPEAPANGGLSESGARA